MITFNRKTWKYEYKKNFITLASNTFKLLVQIYNTSNNRLWGEVFYVEIDEPSSSWTFFVLKPFVMSSSVDQDVAEN